MSLTTHRPVLAIEIGGTTMRAARLSPDGTSPQEVLSRRTPSLADDEGLDAGERHSLVLASVFALADEVLHGARPAAVGVAYPGPMDPRGRVIAAPTVLRTSRGGALDLLGACRSQWPHVPVRVMNDLTAAGEWFVAGGLRDFAVVTIGSGIGHKVFLDGRVRVGQGRGGEMGHLRLDYADDAIRCDCGGYGHLGGVASGRGTVAMVRRAAQRDPGGFLASSLLADAAEEESSGNPPGESSRPDAFELVESLARLEGPAVARAYRRADPFTRAAVAEAVRFLGQGLAAIHLDTGVEDIVLTGGFATAMGEDYRCEVAAAAGAATWAVGQDWDAMVRLGPPSDDAGLIGAGIVAARTLR